MTQVGDKAPLRPWTIPNAISAVRLIGVPVFLWLLLIERADAWALALIAVAGATDWLDGWIARRFGQASRLGELLDPTVDRLYILAILCGFVARGFIPWWLVVVLVGRDAILALLVIPLRSRGIVGLPVTFLGKTATFLLLWGFPFVLAGHISGLPEEFFRTAGWALVIWGTLLYVTTGVSYARQARRALHARPG